MQTYEDVVAALKEEGLAIDWNGLRVVNVVDGAACNHCGSRLGDEALKISYNFERCVCLNRPACRARAATRGEKRRVEIAEKVILDKKTPEKDT